MDPKLREPLFNVPGIVIGLIAVMLLIYGFGDSLLDEETLFVDFAFIPARLGLLFGMDPAAVLNARVLANPSDANRLAASLAQEFAIRGEVKPWTLVTYALLHGSWAHVLLNSVWFVAFGTAVARRFGSVRFLVLFAVTAVGGALAHFATHSSEVIPMVGASASVSGAMAAAMRFAFQPGAPLGVFRVDDSLAYRLPALGLGSVFADRRVLNFALVWFGLNIATGLLAPGLGLVDSSIAWEAHIGGFLTGLLVFPLLDPVPRGPQA
ncbi:rhomboid family intramembrane serine protease [uncultured Alsobacter sp.]|uniref:rhomboid family intramembrane serine protease n=1 Tax=uncultured Alsobacter sp. TaxID=1748258 RepID=UPI0025ED6BB0|nr:rhomboid family intramembrane serine protease [uncultured Alsobacter sp.]